MQWKFAILVLVLALLACNFGAPAQPVSEIPPSPTLESAPATETPAPSTVTVEPSPLPTQTLAPTQPPAPTSAGSSSAVNENRIKFPTGATWVEVGIHLEKGASIQYVLSALKGQVMSVVIEQSWPFVVEVADSTQLLTEPNYARPFWRGTLPTTGDYFITVEAQASGDFNMRVAINPPGQAYQYFDYTSPQGTVTLRYSDEFAPITSVPTGDFKGTPSLVLQFIRPDFYHPTTNLGEAYFLLSSMTDAQKVATCTQPLPQLETIQGQKNFNGYTFTQSETVGVGAGNIYDQVIYRTAYNNVCYEAVFYMHSSNIGNYTPGTVVEFDRAALIQKFEGILSTINLK